MARWATRRAFAEARLTEVGWIASALAAMDDGAVLPPPFDDEGRCWQLLLSDPAVPATLVTGPDGRRDDCLRQAMAFPAIFSARQPDALAVAVEALWNGAASFGYGRHHVLFEEVRKEFPVVR
ncbi:hypothetical protein ABZ639_05670 [Saccharomonospora sp. NPDC006951]